ncbi:MAG: transcriptional repressor [Thermodesulfobacteriota bacterium]|nr:transcriptional repressor [Thermodesulfobacteriota bacterium]
MHGLHEREKIELKRILTQRGHENSEDILAILDTFLAGEEHVTEKQLIRRLKTRGLNLDPVLVHTALELFCRYGFASLKKFDDQEPQYEHRHLGHHHDHIICTRCGRVEEFANPEMEELQDRIARKKGFVPLQHRMEIYGLCPECAKSRRPVAPLYETETGEKVIVIGHTGRERLSRRLMDMGMTKGAELEVLSRNGGPVVVSCRGSRLALGRGMSEKILVTPVKDQGEAA